MAEDNQIVAEATENNAILPEDNMFVVKERFEINYNNPMPEYDTNGAKAYQVKDKINPQRELFALICDNNFPPRLSVLPYLKAIDHPNLMKLVDYSVVDYLPSSTMNMALIYSRPLGEKVSEAKQDGKINSEKIKSLLNSMVSAIEALKAYNISHRAIRLDNIFYKDSECSEIVFGDCAASFPAMYQPDEYETIESLLCVPQGRGNGSSSDDLYAVAVVLLELMFNHPIRLGITTSELLQSKLRKSSLTTLIGNDKVSSQFAPILKGMLEDNADTRWKAATIYNHLEGKSNNFSNSDGVERSMRAISIAGEKYYTAKSASLALLENPNDALVLIKNGKLQDWIKNGLENEKLFNKIEKIIQANKENENNKLLVSQVCIYLDYSLPIKCGDYFIFPDGISKTIYHYTKTHQPLDSLMQVLSGDLVRLWYQEQPYLHAPANSSEFKGSLSRNSYGYGIERIMYDFDEDLPCTSELIGGEFVNTPSKLLRALDNNYNTYKDKSPFDKNIIAYLRCKMGKKIDGIITDINANQDAMRISAVIRLYASIQNKSGPVQLFNLTKWLMKTSKPIISNYHNQKYRKFLEREVVKISKNGKIIDLYEILENEEAKNKDRKEYSEALKKLNLLMAERSRIVSGDAKLDAEAKELAIKFGSILAILSMLSSFVFSVIYWVLK
ncbi:MAG: hypothetical protein E7012_03150 [Alphaproteobacteria bacterium]|nr:hypothetical protein [Alphaproteobacteria bacterium]